MKNPITKSNIRRPIKAMLFTALLLIASFTFVSSLSQYVIVNKAINDIGAYYKSIGMIQPKNPEAFYINEARNLIANDDMIEYEDDSRACQGIIEGINNPQFRQQEHIFEEGYYNNHLSGDIVFIAELESAPYKPIKAKTIYEAMTINTLPKKLLAGYDDVLKVDRLHTIYVYPKSIWSGKKYDFITNEAVDELWSLKPEKNIYLERICTWVFRISQ